MEIVGLKMLFSAIFGGIGSFISNVVTFLTTKPGVYILAAGLVLGTLWYSNHAGYARAHREDVAAQKLVDAQHALEDQAAITAAYKVGLARQQQWDKALSTVAYNAGVAKGKEQAKTITIIKRIPTYVSAETDWTFPVPCGLLRLHDAAALGVPAESLTNPSGLVDGAACPATASHLAEVIVTNYGIDHEKDVQIEGLQDLVRTLAAEMAQ